MHFPRISSASRPIVLYCSKEHPLSGLLARRHSHHIVVGDMRLDALLWDTGRGNNHMQDSQMSFASEILFGRVSMSIFQYAALTSYTG
jgi:hypothetical protein